MKAGRKKRTGIVISDKGTKTVIVKVLTVKVEPIMHKRLKFFKKYKVHDEKDECKVGYTVEIEECRPVSRTKRWKVRKILKATTLEKIELKDELEALKPKEEPVVSEEKTEVQKSEAPRG